MTGSTSTAVPRRTSRVLSLASMEDHPGRKMRSRLLDMRDCADGRFAAIHREMLRLDLQQQPRWFRPLLSRSGLLKKWTGFNHWSRAWEYPWAVLAADIGEEPLRILDVGGGGSPFSLYLAGEGHECCVADPSLDRGESFVLDRERSLYRNARSLMKRLLFRAAGVKSLWGLPASDGRTPVRYLPYPAHELRFPDGHFDRVFCLSVMEHVRADLWPKCMREFERVLRAGGHLVLTLDMTLEEANRRLYADLIETSSLDLIGEPIYEVPIDPHDQQRRHPGHGYETVGLVWRKRPARDA